MATDVRRTLARWIGATCLLALASVRVPAMAGDGYGTPPPDLKLHLDRLVRAYPDWITGADDRFLRLKNGGKFPISDGRTDKSFDELLEHPDIDDMFYVPYPAATTPAPPAKNIDPGRVRFEPLFVAMYGDCHKNEVAPKLKAVDWLPQHNGGKVSVTTVNGVAEALAMVSLALDQLPVEFVKFLIPNAGTYNCRDIAGSSMRSAHAYGTAIDISTKSADYWRWSANPQGRRGKTAFRSRSRDCSSNTDSFGAATGIILIRCISSTARNCCRKRRAADRHTTTLATTRQAAAVFGHDDPTRTPRSRTCKKRASCCWQPPSWPARRRWRRHNN